jgi:hypothetical protein
MRLKEHTKDAVSSARRDEVVGVVRLRRIEELKSAYSHATNEGIEQPLPDLLACEDAPH